jgi:hypothetical protein
MPLNLITLTGLNSFEHCPDESIDAPPAMLNSILPAFRFGWASWTRLFHLPARSDVDQGEGRGSGGQYSPRAHESLGLGLWPDIPGKQSDLALDGQCGRAPTAFMGSNRRVHWIQFQGYLSKDHVSPHEILKTGLCLIFQKR